MFKTIAISTDFPMVLDGIMVVAIAGLWIAWWRNVKRQRQVECMLADSARQLQEASQHLKLAMACINNSKKKVASHQGAESRRQKETQATMAVPGDAQIAQVLRMQHEGTPAEDIASRLNLPLSQIKLALKLHAARTH